jgi:thymidylate synthase (FAD)
VIHIVTEPTVIPLSEQRFIPGALQQVIQSIREAHPECYPSGYAKAFSDFEGDAWCKAMLFPHEGWERTRQITDNELLVELSGRLCYYSFGAKAGTPDNAGYIANTQLGQIPHKSLMYHPKMTFFLSGISRRLTHELIRHYVGADRDEEGSPSQESTRYVEHPGWFVVHPWVYHSEADTSFFQDSMLAAYNNYRAYIHQQEHNYREMHEGKDPKGLNRKRIYEAASSFLPHSAMTSLVWTTNPEALKKLFLERTNEYADLEFQRLASLWKNKCIERWPNLFQERA